LTVDYTRELNNYLQSIGKVDLLQWANQQSGPPHERVHTMTAWRTYGVTLTDNSAKRFLVEGEALGTGQGSSMNSAKKPAAYQALVKLGKL